jgi:nickel transport protein
MRSALLAFLLLLIAVAPASAHRLRLFATVEDGATVGYAFFIGGGRPAMATLLVRDASGMAIHRSGIDVAGAFRWQPPAAATYRLVVDTGDGHSAIGTITADRLGAVALPAAPTAPAAATAHASTACAAADLASLVDAAVARQVAPLLDAHAAAEARLRFNDVAGGIGMILGLGGVWAWAASRRRALASGPGQ